MSYDATFMHVYVFSVQSNGGVAIPLHPLLVDFEDLPYPRGKSYTLRHPGRFCIKMTAKDARVVIKNNFARNLSVLECHEKTFRGVNPPTHTHTHTRARARAHSLR